MIDLHCHLVAGIDDGPSGLDEALLQARAHVAAGVTTVACTPHVDQSHRNTAASIAAATTLLRERLTAEGVELRLLNGAEVSLSRAVELPDDELAALHLGQSDWLLVEPPLGSDVPRLEQTVAGLIARGHRVLIAHPERCAGFHHDPALLERVVRVGAAAQVTASSFTGRFGGTVQRLAGDMLDAGLVHVVASDAHNVESRPPGLAAPLQSAGLAELVDWACDAVPSALLAGDGLPPRPVLPRARKRRLFGRR